MDGPIEGGVVPALVRQHGVVLEAAPCVIGLALDDDIRAEREMMRDVAPVAKDRGYDFRYSRLLQRPARRFRLAHLRKLKPACGRKGQATVLRHEPGGIADRSHLDGRLRAIDEAVEHLRV